MILSTGTRIQLLLSVRLAFIETQEPAVKLPILADELLANSDDIRASAIIEALTEISKEGRQIFYFTAQDDEVARWQNHLNGEEDGIFRIIRLPGTREEYPANSHKPPFPAFIHHVPPPGKADHIEYGRKLGVEPFNLLTGETTQLHVWYFVEDNTLLFRMLKSGLSSFGQLESFLRHGGKIENFTEEVWQSIKNKGLVFDRFLELYRTGRSKPIDRQTLERSGAVTDTFIDGVSALLEKLSGDPEKLLDALQRGDVSGFRHNKYEQLRDYLLREGLIDDRPVVPHEEIMLRLRAYISGHEFDVASSERFLNRILNPGL